MSMGIQHKTPLASELLLKILREVFSGTESTVEEENTSICKNQGLSITGNKLLKPEFIIKITINSSARKFDKTVLLTALNRRKKDFTHIFFVQEDRVRLIIQQGAFLHYGKPWLGPQAYLSGR